jgi:hypothetical protein
MTLSEAYVQGWRACEANEDGRFTNPHPRKSDLADAWNVGFTDCMEAEYGDEPDPACAGYLG